MSQCTLDKIQLVDAVEELLTASGHSVKKSVRLNSREIDIVAHEQQGFTPKTILIECAAYAGHVGVSKLQDDIKKLEAARDADKFRTICMHVSSNGYTTDANTYAEQNGLTIFSITQLQNRVINFTPYFEAVLTDIQRQSIELEYQQTKISPEGNTKLKKPALSFIDEWLSSDEKWLTILGDYGVGKSWLLKKLLYSMLDKHLKNPFTAPIPFFIPLQNFTKAFDFKNLITRTLDDYGVMRVSYDAFMYIARKGKVVYLLDSFDEMAQSLSATTLKNNLRELLSCIGSGSKAIMTSRPTYFESRAERLLVIEREGLSNWHPLDTEIYHQNSALTREIKDSLYKAQFARLNDLTNQQRKELFKITLRNNPEALRLLNTLFDKHSSLESLSQRAVIARMLTVVATYLSAEKQKSSDIVSTIISKCREFNQSVIFEILIYTLLDRDINIGDISASGRHEFLIRVAILLQQPGRSLFATPREIKNIVEGIFKAKLLSSDSYQTLIENHYRTCRRHSGLTTETQFYDTSGSIDAQVDSDDGDSNVGFSHNSIREYLCASAIYDYIIKGTSREGVTSLAITDAICEFLYEMNINEDILSAKIGELYTTSSDSRMRHLCLKLALYFTGKNHKFIKLLGEPAKFWRIDLSLYDFSALDLSNAIFEECIMCDTDFRKANLKNSNFTGSSIEGAMFDDSKLSGSDFGECEILSIFVYDQFDSKTTSFLNSDKARQWLYHNGALISDMSGVNTLLSNKWYIATQEVAKTLKAKHAGTFTENALFKGTDVEYRELAVEFVDYLQKSGVLEFVRKSTRTDCNVVKLNKDFRAKIAQFVDEGIIFPEISSFLEKRIRDFTD